MVRILLLLFFIWPWPAHSQERVTDFLLLELPTDTVRIQDIAQDPHAYDWQVSYNGYSFLARARKDYFLLMRLPVWDKQSYVLQFPLRKATVAEIEYNYQVYLLEDKTARVLTPEEDRFASFVIDPSLQGRTVLVKIRTGPFAAGARIDMDLIKPEAFRKQTRFDLLMIGFVSGIIAIMAIYNLGLLYLLRKPYLFYYSVYSVATLYWLNIALGMIDLNSWIIFTFHTAVEVIHVSIVLFSFTMLHARTDYPILHRLSRVFIGSSLAVLGALLLGVEQAVYVYYSITPGSMVLCVILAARSAWKGYKPAYLLLAGWLILLLGIMIVTLASFTDDVPNLLWLGPVVLTVEVVTFSFAIGQKIRMTEQAFRQQNQHAFTEMRKMIYEHQLDRIRQGEHLESTMPTHSGQAVVISLDVIASSKIKHTRTKEFFRQVFARCNGIMLEGYDGRELKAHGYRIKEMGDGFLCSVGYPFAPMSDNPARDALVLARRFAEVLDEEARIMQFQEPIACGIGIAQGSITGFYPEAGAKEYDLYGRAIVLATRYEGMRKILFEDQKDRSVLILQDSVYQALDIQDRLGFQTVDLRERGVGVRDDVGARQLHVLWLRDEAGAQKAV